MKKAFSLLCVLLAAAIQVGAQSCATCGKTGANSPKGDDVGPNISISMMNMLGGQSAGALIFSSSTPDPELFTPAALQFGGPAVANITVITTNVVVTNVLETLVETNGLALVTNITTVTNVLTDDPDWEANTDPNITVLFWDPADYDHDGVVATITAYTNVSLATLVSYEDDGTYVTAIFTQSQINVLTPWAVSTNVTAEVDTNVIILQVQAPQVVADVPPPPTTNGYVVNLYYTNQVTGLAGGLCQFFGQPFMTWTITNPATPGTNQLQVTQSDPTDGVLKQWNYVYYPGTKTWTMQPLGGAIQENMTVTNLSATTYQIIDSFQSPSGPIVQQSVATYQYFNWSSYTNVALTRLSIGSGTTPEVTAYTYWDPANFGAGSVTLVQNVTHPDGSWEYYAGYDPNGNPTNVYSSFNNVTPANYSNARQTVYIYDPVAAGVSASGDDGTANSRVPRLTIVSVQGHEVSRTYRVFPAVNERLDIRCTAAGASWTAAGNLVTTNWFYTSGPNRFLLQSVIRPDGTMTTCDYATNSGGTYWTNMTATGQPDSLFTHVVDGTTNRTVLNQWGHMVSSTTWDVRNPGIVLLQDTYASFDSYGRPQQVTHLDGTVEQTIYTTCCGLDRGIDRDGVTTQYLYDPAKRQIGYGRNGITYTNALDAVGRTLQSIRVGSDNSVITLSQAKYDLASELIAQTNGLGGGTAFAQTLPPTTGTKVRTTTNPDTGTRVETYYLDGTLKSVTGTAAHGMAYGRGVEYVSTLNSYCSYTVATNLDASGNPTSEWTKTYTDTAGRPVEVLYPDNSYSQSFYNGAGQLWKQVDPDGVTTLYTYNTRGERDYTLTAISSTARGLASYTALTNSLTSLLGGTDRITYVTNDVTFDSGVGANVSRTRTYAWENNSSSTSTLISTTERSADGLRTWNITWNNGAGLTNSSQTVYAGGGARYVTNTAPDNSSTVNYFLNGQSQSVSRLDSNGKQIAQTSYGYDAHGRQYTVTDARNGMTTYAYNAADLVTNVTTPAPAPGQPAETTTTFYNPMLQASGVLNPDNTTVTNIYLLTGELGETYGSRTYPVQYTYDYAGRMQTMTTWTNFTGSFGAATTTWNYDLLRGWLTNKAYADSKGPFYTYTPAGRLASRKWARGITTTYTTNCAGDVLSIKYDDGVTPGITNGYDRRGRLTAVTNGATVCGLAYNDANELLTESYTNGPLGGLTVSNHYDALLRRDTLALDSASANLNSTLYGYDAASRLQTVTGGNLSAGYTYVANSPLVGQIQFKQGSATRMTTMKSYDNLNRLTAITSAGAAGQLPVNFNYAYNPANQRTRNTEVDGSYWVYQYDRLGQVTDGCKYWSDGTPVAGQQFGYAFDDIGNRTQTRFGGTNGLWTNSYTANSLNQYTSRTVPGTNDIIGAAWKTNGVTVNGVTAYRRGEYFQSTVGTNNSGGPGWLGVTVAGGTNVTGNLFIARTPEQFGYDADGNLTNDGRWSYSWDAENRLTNMTSLATAPAGSKLKLDFAYDWKGRRVQKIVSTNNGSYVPQYTNKFVYDGWNLMATLNPQSAVVQSYVWGSDLSGSMQGAGGVGGLLAINDSVNGTNFCAYDGNGNIMALVKASDGTLSANYEYGPFGEVIRATGPMARANPIRFSTKYQDDESDQLYYGYRYYKPSTGAWVSRDPAEEDGGLNLYGFCRNDAIDSVDSIGQYSLFDIDLKPCYSYNVTATWTVKVLRNLTVWPDRYSDADVIAEVNAELNKIFPMSGDSGPECQCSSRWNLVHIDTPLNITQDQTEYLVVKVRVFLNLHIVADVWKCCGK